MSSWSKKFGVACTAAFLSTTMAAHAADVVNTQPQSQVVKPKVEDEVGPWQIRVRALGVLPKDGGSVRLDGAHASSSGLNFQDTVVPELDISYFFTKNIAAELILGTTYSKISGRNELSSYGRLGKTWILPPTLTLQYHFTNFGKFQPYIGAGVNYTVFYNESDWGLSNLKINNTWGGAAQIGFDYMFTKHWGVNFDVKKLWLNPSYRANLDTTRVTGRVKLDPWLIGTGITYRF